MIQAQDSLAYVKHLHHEHDRLQRMLREINDEFAQLVPYGQFATARVGLAKRLEDLREQLLRHCADEEAGGCLEEAITCCPSLAGRAGSILKEHAYFQQVIDALVAQVSDVATSTAKLQCNFEQFVEELHVHEAAETHVLHMAFGGEFADYDDADSSAP